MRKILLTIPVLLLSIVLQGQTINEFSIEQVTSSSEAIAIQKSDLKIYPNPANNFIHLREVSGISSIIVYNLVGRKIRSFIAEKGRAYSIADLPKGMYLIQLLDLDGKVLTTQRMSKK